MALRQGATELFLVLTLLGAEPLMHPCRLNRESLTCVGTAGQRCFRTISSAQVRYSSSKVLLLSAASIPRLYPGFGSDSAFLSLYSFPKLCSCKSYLLYKSPGFKLAVCDLYSGSHMCLSSMFGTTGLAVRFNGPHIDLDS